MGMADQQSRSVQQLNFLGTLLHVLIKSFKKKKGEGFGFIEDTLKMALPAMDETLREDGAGTPGFLPMASCGSPIPTDVVNAFALTGSTAVVALVEFDDCPPSAILSVSSTKPNP